MLGDGPRCSVGWQFFLSVLILYYYRTYFRHHNNEKKRKTTGWWHARNTHWCKQVVLSRTFKRMVPVDYSYQSKRSIRNLFFYLSSNNFASFLSQTSILVHRSLHLSIWSPRYTSHDLYLRCRSLASRANPNSRLSLLWLHNLHTKK